MRKARIEDGELILVDLDSRLAFCPYSLDPTGTSCGHCCTMFERVKLPKGMPPSFGFNIITSNKEYVHLHCGDGKSIFELVVKEGA